MRHIGYIAHRKLRLRAWVAQFYSINFKYIGIILFFISICSLPNTALSFHNVNICNKGNDDIYFAAFKFDTDSMQKRIYGYELIEAKTCKEDSLGASRGYYAFFKFIGNRMYNPKYDFKSEHKEIDNINDDWVISSACVSTKEAHFYLGTEDLDDSRYDSRGLDAFLGKFVRVQHCPAGYAKARFSFLVKLEGNSIITSTFSLNSSGPVEVGQFVAIVDFKPQQGCRVVSSDEIKRRSRGQNPRPKCG